MNDTVEVRVIALDEHCMNRGCESPPTVLLVRPAAYRYRLLCTLCASREVGMGAVAAALALMLAQTQKGSGKEAS